jgi:hypothetical protein
MIDGARGAINRLPSARVPMITRSTVLDNNQDASEDEYFVLKLPAHPGPLI